MGISKGIEQIQEQIDEMELKTDLEIIEHKKMDSCYGTLVYFITHTVPMFFHWFGSDKEWHKK